jgi:hypothetical protein
MVLTGRCFGGKERSYFVDEQVKVVSRQLKARMEADDGLAVTAKFLKIDQCTVSAFDHNHLCVCEKTAR